MLSFVMKFFALTLVQIGKQLRSMPRGDDDMFSSRTFSTNVGLRPAEACSVSVVATQQLLTQIFMHVSISLLADSDIRHFCKAVVTEADLQILARCNEDCIQALEDIVGTSSEGKQHSIPSESEKELRKAGDVWSNHVLYDNLLVDQVEMLRWEEKGQHRLS